MCIQNTTSRDGNSYQPGGSLHSAPIPPGHATNEGRSNSHYSHTPYRTPLTSPAAASNFALASMPVFSAIDQSPETMEELMYMQPPPHVIDYWFDRLGLSLDPPSAENPSNSVD